VQPGPEAAGCCTQKRLSPTEQASQVPGSTRSRKKLATVLALTIIYCEQLRTSPSSCRTRTARSSQGSISPPHLAVCVQAGSCPLCRRPSAHLVCHQLLEELQLRVRVSGIIAVRQERLRQQPRPALHVGQLRRSARSGQRGQHEQQRAPHRAPCNMPVRRTPAGCANPLWAQAAQRSACADMENWSGPCAARQVCASISMSAHPVQ
jgi:hypothetical protein